MSLLYFNGEKTKDISHIRVSSMFVLQNVTVFCSNKQTTSGLFQVCEVSTKILKVLHAILVSAILLKKFYRETLGDFYCRVYNWSKPPIATPRKCMYCAFTCINSKHFIHQKNSESLATIPISWYVSITTGRIVNLRGRGD